MTNSEKLKQSRIFGLYVSLDSLLDTRFAILTKMLGPKIVNIPHDVYVNRIREEFPGVDKAEFARLYASRDSSIVKKSVVTNVLKIIKDFSSKAELEISKGARVDSAIVNINIWPYDLNRAECDAIVAAVKHYIEGPAEVSVINLSPDQLSASFCKQTYSSMVMYDFNEWMDAQFNPVKLLGPVNTVVSHYNLMRVHAEVAMPNVDLLVPSLLRGAEISDEKIAEEVKAGMHPFRGLEIDAQALIRLRVIDTKHFCVHD